MSAPIRRQLVLSEVEGSNGVISFLSLRGNAFRDRGNLMK
jgi:hypothetical protein